jgi:eukaryotic-like serine/threonine-protein kinase
VTNATPRRRRRASRPCRVGAGRRLVGRYRLIRRIGHGGSAEVWQARDERLYRTVAIKTLHPHLLPDAASRARFATEARAAAGLSHPAIVPVYDVIEDPASPAIVLRYVSGTTLADRLLASGPMSEREVVAIGADLAGALDHAHRLGIVHRDLKPGNVLIDDDGRAQLVDFGIARFLADAASRDTTSGQVMGTLRYMAPEQLAGTRADARTDLYALGLLLHELLAGTSAFDATSPADLVDAQRRGPPQPPSRAGAELRALLATLLAPDPADRPSDAGAVEARLAAMRSGFGTRSEADETSPLPTLMPGLPAATAGLAIAAPSAPVRGWHDSDSAVDHESSAERDTVPLPAAATAAIAVPAGQPSGSASGLTGSPGRALRRPVSRPGSRFPVRGRNAVLGAAGLAVAAAVLVAAAWGLSLNQPAAVAGMATPSPLPASPHPSATPKATVRPVAPAPRPAAKPHPKRRKHGEDEGG